jgi:hypothetical protein
MLVASFVTTGEKVDMRRKLTDRKAEPEVGESEGREEKKGAFGLMPDCEPLDPVRT